ncbi:MAG: aldolase/citrate lyase family protein [Dehalococcoidia bacterium]
MFKNTVKEKLAAGKAVWGVMANDPSPPVLEILGYSGFDWVLLDNEHGNITAENLPNCVRACEASGLVPIVRPIAGRMDVITPFMDMGAYGVQVPHVNTPEDAKAVVDAVKYPPMGNRGFFSSNRNNKFGLGMPAGEYLEMSNQETLVCLMIEEVEGVRNAEAIASVEGVDVVFVGSGDLSVSMGFPGQNTHPEVVKSVEGAVAAILRAGKIPGCSCPDDQAPRWLDKGVRFFHSGVWRLLSRSCKDYLDRMHAAASDAGVR